MKSGQGGADGSAPVGSTTSTSIVWNSLAPELVAPETKLDILGGKGITIVKFQP